MINISKALEVLGLPQEMEAYNGQVQTRVMRGITVYENYDSTSGKMVIYYTVEFNTPAPVAFGLYPFNFAANSIYHMGHQVLGQTPRGFTLKRPSTWVVHPAISGLAGQNVYYVESNIYFTPTTIEQTYEPYETVVNGVADDMKDPMIRCQYKARLWGRDTTGTKVVKWESKYAITPKKKLRRAEFLKLIPNKTMDDVIWESRVTYNIVPVKGETHITSIAMDIDKPTNNTLNSTVYINGVDAKTFDYKKLINSFGKLYDGYMQMYRLNNGPSTTITTDNVYGSTLNIGCNPNEDNAITIAAGSTNSYNIINKTLTYNPDLTEEAKLIAYMEFLPAGGKNENCGKEISLETGIEKLF
jgi:hypothetical protein